MPHPKMDASSTAWRMPGRRGRKTLVFVRRVASVKELKRKLDERYDDWLMRTIATGTARSVQARLEDVLATLPDGEAAGIERKRRSGAQRWRDSQMRADQGGTDTFFAWFFRGEGPRGVISGANIQQRFIQRGSGILDVLRGQLRRRRAGMPPGRGANQTRLVVLGVSVEELRVGLRDRSRRFLSGRARSMPRPIATRRYRPRQSSG